jgi:hypothetical protein
MDNEGDMIMTTSSSTSPVPFHGDKIVRRLDEFPDLVQALRDGDLLTGRMFCARLFDFDARRGLHENNVTATQQLVPTRMRLV